MISEYNGLPMTTIFCEDTEEIFGLQFIVNGINDLTQIIANCGHDGPDEPVREGVDFVMKSDEADWWAQWVERENIINAAYDEADEETRKRYGEAVSEYGYEMDTLQDVLEDILGIER